MEAAGLVESVVQPKQLRFNFEDVKKLPPPIIAFSDVAFSYSGDKKDYLYRELNFGIDMDSRYDILGFGATQILISTVLPLLEIMVLANRHS